LKWAWRNHDASIQKLVEERGKAEGISRLHVIEVAAFAFGKANRKHRRCTLHVVRYALSGKRRRNQIRQTVCMRGKTWVQGFIGKLERCQTRCHGHWVAGQRTRLVDGTNRREGIQHVCEAGESSAREA